MPRRLRRAVTALFAATAAAGAAPAAAGAITINVQFTPSANGPDHVTIVGTDAAETVGLGRDLNAPFTWRLTSSVAAVITVGGPGSETCTNEGQPGLRLACTVAANHTVVDATMGGGDDTLGVSHMLGSTGGTVDMGAGNDRFDVSENTTDRAGLTWSVDGGPGNDLLFHQDAVAETDADTPSHDHISGGEGQDFIKGNLDDVLDAGPGSNEVVQPDDSEAKITTAQGGSATGGPGDDIFRTSNDGNPEALKLVNGAVALRSGSTPALPEATSGFRSLFLLGPGGSLEGDGNANRLVGAGSANTLIGNGGDDLIIASPGGGDTIDAGDGNDTINALNHAADTIDCGPGLDTNISFDPQDTLINCEVSTVVISSGPTGTVASASATFEFSAIGAPPSATFECALDTGAFNACTSPATLSNLPEGPHTFKVRLVTGGTPGSPAQRQWTVDTTKPEIVVDQAPSGTGNPSDVTIAFHASEATTFTCSLDGASPGDCSSPVRLTGLLDGPHSFTIDATDSVGNQAAQSRTISWTVGSTGPPPPNQPPNQPPTCAPPGQATVTIGVITAVATSADGCFQPVPGLDPTARASTGEVRVNGIRLTPRGGALIIDAGLSGGTLRTAGAYTVAVGKVSFDLETPLNLDGLASTASAAVQRAIKLGANDIPKLLGLPLRGNLTLSFSADNGGSTTIALTVKLPHAFHAVPGPATQANQGVEGLTFDVSATASNDKGVTFAGKGKVGEAWLFGKVKLKDLEIGVDQAQGTFSGSVGLSLGEGSGAKLAPGNGKDGTLTAAIEIGPGGLFDTSLRKLSLKASELERPVGDGVFFQRLGLELSSGTAAGGGSALVLAGSGGASLGKKLSFPPVFDGEAVSVDGTVKLTISTAVVQPWAIEFKGTGKIADIPVTEQRIAYSPPARFETSGKIDLSVGGFGLLMDIRNSWYDVLGRDFEIEAAGALRLPGLGGPTANLLAEGVLSGTGMAACVGQPGERFGFGKLWFEDLQTFIGVCDLQPFRSTIKPQTARAGGAQSFTVKPGSGVVAVAAHGTSGAPKIGVSGPGGAHAATPDGLAPARTAAALIVQDPATSTTWVILHRPAAGRWTITPHGSGGLTGIRVADPLPPVHLRARVTGRGARRTLTWRLSPGADQALTFTELGSRTSRVMLTTRRLAGHLTFTPDIASGTARRIVATVVHRGLPRLAQTVARFRVPAPPRLLRVAGVRRSKGVLRWRRQAGAAAYAYAIGAAGAPTLNGTTTRPKLALPTRARHTTITVTLVALGHDGRPGPATTVRIR